MHRSIQLVLIAIIGQCCAFSSGGGAVNLTTCDEFSCPAGMVRVLDAKDCFGNTTIMCCATDPIGAAYIPQRYQPFYMMPMSDSGRVVTQFIGVGFVYKFDTRAPMLPKSLSQLPTVGFIVLAINGWAHDISRWSRVEELIPKPQNSFWMRMLLRLAQWVTSPNYVAAVAIWSAIALQSPLLLDLKPRYTIMPGLFGVPLNPLATSWFKPAKWVYAVILLPYLLPILPLYAMSIPFLCGRELFACFCQCKCVAVIVANCKCCCCGMISICKGCGFILLSLLTLLLWRWARSEAWAYEVAFAWVVYAFLLFVWSAATVYAFSRFYSWALSLPATTMTFRDMSMLSFGAPGLICILVLEFKEYPEYKATRAAKRMLCALNMEIFKNDFFIEDILVDEDVDAEQQDDLKLWKVSIVTETLLATVGIILFQEIVFTVVARIFWMVQLSMQSDDPSSTLTWHNVLVEPFISTMSERHFLTYADSLKAKGLSSFWRGSLYANVLWNTL